MSQVFKTKEELYAAAEELAQTIASKSPVAIYGTKYTLNYSLSHPVDDGLQQIAMLNGAFLQTDDLQIAAAATMSK